MIQLRDRIRTYNHKLIIKQDREFKVSIERLRIPVLGYANRFTVRKDLSKSLDVLQGTINEFKTGKGSRTVHNQYNESQKKLKETITGAVNNIHKD